MKEKEQKVILPELSCIKKTLTEWAAYYPRITKIYLFGSYVKRDKPAINDIDIAIELSYKNSDTPFNYWCSEGNRMEKQLSRLLKYEVGLDYYAGDETPIVKKGLEEGNIIVYEK